MYEFEHAHILLYLHFSFSNAIFVRLPYLGGGGGVLVEKLFCSFFNPVISLYIYYDQYEKIWRKPPKKMFFPAVGFHGNGGHIRF